MANVNAPLGFHAKKKLSGGFYHDNVYPFFVPSTDATALYKGDPVDLAGSSNSSAFGGYKAGTLPTVTKATAGATNKILGFMVDVVHPTDIDDSLRKMYRVASTDTIILVTLANDMIFEAQSDEDLEAGDVGSNFNYVAGSGGSTVTGFSSAQIDSSSVGQDATYQLSLLRISDRPDNALGNYCDAEVYVNLPRIAPATAGV